MQYKDYTAALLDLVFPPRCVACDRYLQAFSKETLCRQCLAEVTRMRPPCCPLCGIEIESADDVPHLCGACLKKPPPYTAARSLFHYQGPVRTIVSRLKYAGDLSVKRAIKALVGDHIATFFADCDLIVPVPLHRKKLRQRGFNQSMLIAEICFENHKKRIKPTLLRRNVATVPQVSLDAKRRRKSLKNVFSLADGVDVQGLSVGLVDDVFTTGTTVAECARVFRKNGAARVLVFTLARTVEQKTQAVLEVV